MGTLKTDTPTAADMRCIIVQGIQNWFLTGDANDPPIVAPILVCSNQLVPSSQRLNTTEVEYAAACSRVSSEVKEKGQNTKVANNGRDNLLGFSGRRCADQYIHHNAS
jgi:hypothetical protein